MGDMRTDSGQFYPGGKVHVRPEESPPQTTVAWNDVTDKPESFPPSSHNHTKSQITDFPNFKTINGESIAGMGNIEISGGWKNLGYVAFEDDDIQMNIADVANKSVRQYQSGTYGYYGEIIIPEDFDFAEFFVEADLLLSDRYYSLEFPDSAMIYSRYGTMWSKTVTLAELIDDWKRFSYVIQEGYLTRIVIRKTDSYYVVEVN